MMSCISDDYTKMLFSISHRLQRFENKLYFSLISYGCLKSLFDPWFLIILYGQLSYSKVLKNFMLKWFFWICGKSLLHLDALNVTILLQCWLILRLHWSVHLKRQSLWPYSFFAFCSFELIFKCCNDFPITTGVLYFFKFDKTLR